MAAGPRSNLGEEGMGRVARIGYLVLSPVPSSVPRRFRPAGIQSKFKASLDY